MLEQLSLLDLPPQPELPAAPTSRSPRLDAQQPDPAPAVKFAPSDIVTIAPLRWEKAGKPHATTIHFAGSVVGYSPGGMVLVNIGVGQPYPCSEKRLTKYTGVVSLWRWWGGDSPHWSYAGTMSVEPFKPRWPDAMWFPAGYDPNESRSGND